MVPVPPLCRLSRRLATTVALGLALGSVSVAQLAPEPQLAAEAERHALVRVQLAGPEQARVLSELGLDLTCGASVSGEDGLLHELVASPADLAALADAGLDHSVLIPDLTAHFQARFASPESYAGVPSVGAGLVPTFGQGSIAGFWTWTEIVSVLDQLTAQHPAITTDKVSIGTTAEGRDIWMVKISDNPDVDESEPEVRIDAMHHSREPQSMTSVMWFATWLLEGYGSDPLATYLVDEREIWLIPIVNPDGYVYNEQTAPAGGGLWRKNRFNNGDGTFGVDLNRNYPFEWGHDNSGSSPSTNSTTYRGPSAGSELETQHMLALMASRNFVTAISAHSASNVWIRPWGYDTNAALPNQAAYDEIGNAAAPNGWPVGTGVDTLGYPANGVTNDTDQATHATLSWTPEIGTTSDSFWPSTDRIIPLAEEVFPGIQGTVLAAGAWLRVLAVAEAEEGDGDGFVEAGETLALTLDLRNSGMAATLSGVDLTLTTSSPDATVTTGAVALASLGSFASADNAANPLRLALDAGTPSGTLIEYELGVSAEGYTQTLAGSFVSGKSRPFLVDDVEVDLGWTAGVPGDTANTGLWERADPVAINDGGTPLTPGDDHTPGAATQAFVTGNSGSSAGNDDVDDGFTTLISPPFDLSGVGPATLSYARWHADLLQADDVFEVSISNDDGQNWTSLESVAGNANAWATPEFLVSGVLAQTDAMRLRFVADDDPNNSWVEALVDDLRVDVFDAAPRVNLYGAQLLGEDLRFNVSAEGGSTYTWYLSPFTADLQIGLIQGKLLLDPAFLVALFSSSVPAGDLAALDLTMPGDASLSGVPLYLQAFVKQGGIKYLSNRVTLELE